MQALGEASEDPELKRHLREHMREVHDFVADLIRRGQAQGAIVAERDADAEAWIMLAGGILGMVGRRVGSPGRRRAPGNPRRPPRLAPRLT